MIDESVDDPDQPARRELLDALALAFRDNPMNVAIHGPDPGRRIRANRAGLRALVLDTAGRAIARVIRHEGEVVGGFVVVPPGGFPLPRQRILRQIGCFFSQGARAMDQWSEVTATLGLHHPTLDHWYLAVLGVVPSLHHRGFGSRLIEDLIRLSEETRDPIYLESDRDQSRRFYEARGFTRLGELRIHGVPCWCLGRGFAGASADLCDSVRQL